MKLILTRHGETVENVKGVLQGQLEGELSKKGIEQAKKLAKRLKIEKIDAIYSSDLARASDSVKQIAKYHEEVPLVFVEELRERNLGSFARKKIKDVDLKNFPKDAEKKSAMRKRAKKILDKVYKKYKCKCVLFVGHREINRILMRIVLNQSLKESEKMERPANTSVIIFEIMEDEDNKVHLLNCVKHLN